MLVVITELLQKTVKVNVDTEEDALSKAEEMYYDENVVLNADDYKGEVYFEVVKGE